jgi:hypothetical protein
VTGPHFRERMIGWIALLFVLALLKPAWWHLLVGGGSYLILFWRELGPRRTR